MSKMPRIGITMGDPAGIGPEIVVKALGRPEVREICTAVVYGDVPTLEGAAAALGGVEVAPAPTRDTPAGRPEAIDRISGGFSKEPGSRRAEAAPRPLPIVVLQATDSCLDDLVSGAISAAAGCAAAQCVVAAANAALIGEIDAMVTAPLNKESMALGGFPYPGHTELLAAIANCSNYGMLLLSGGLRVVHVSTHVSLRTAIDRVRTDRILECIRLGERACRELGIPAPRVAVAGLNPHAGENGLFGLEEIEEISPAVEAAKAAGIDATGPHPPDTVFARNVKGEFDLVVAMYHDQGHIPVKLHGFDRGVNVTIGLPLIRVSVDHGTAFDIAGMGVASEQSMVEAIRVAVQMVESKRTAGELA